MYQRLQEMPVGKKVGENSIHSDFRVFSADFLNKTKIPETLINQGFRELADPVNYDTRDDASCRVQQRVHLHPWHLQSNHGSAIRLIDLRMSCHIAACENP